MQQEGRGEGGIKKEQLWERHERRCVVRRVWEERSRKEEGCAKQKGREEGIEKEWRSLHERNRSGGRNGGSGEEGEWCGGSYGRRGVEAGMKDVMRREVVRAR